MRKSIWDAIEGLTLGSTWGLIVLLFVLAVIAPRVDGQTTQPITITPTTQPQTVTITVGALPPIPPAPAPTVITVQAAPKPMAIGTNVAPNDYWNTCGMWCDVTHQFTGWYPQPSNGPVITYDANGYPAAVANGAARAHTFLYGYPTGTYHLHWAGPQSAMTCVGRTLNNLKAETSPSNGWGADITANAGDMVILQTSGGISDVHLTAPDATAGQTFRNAYLNILKPYKVIRLMPLEKVNGDPATWPVPGTKRSGRTLPTAWDQTTNEVALEYQAELCREAGCIPWVCCYYGDSDANIAATAQIFAGFPLVYCEMQNELWNQGGGYQGNLIRSDAQKAGIYGTGDINQLGARRAASLAAHVGSIFRQVLGSSHVKVVFGAQATWNAWASDGLGFLPPGQIDLLAVAPYFGWNQVPANPTVEQVLAGADLWITTILDPGLKANAQVARQYGCDFGAYEAGQSFFPQMQGPPSMTQQPANAAQLAAFNADVCTLAQSDLMMGTTYDLLFATCRAEGMTLCCHFMAVGYWGSAGYWGAVQVTGDPPNAKTQAISRAITAAGN